MNPLSRIPDLLRWGLRWIDSRTVPAAPGWGWAARIWVEPRWSFLCLLFLLAVLMHPPEGLPFRFCLFHLISGVDCPGCGMTRALSHLLHGQLAEALKSHPFSPLVLLYLILQSLSPFLPTGFKIRVAEEFTRHDSLLRTIFWFLTGLFLLYGFGRAAYQFILQGVSWSTQGVPSFRMEW